MDRGTRIARTQARAHNKLRRIFLRDQCLKLLSGDQNNWTEEATYDTHWYLDRREYSDVIAGKKYKRLVVDDTEGCRLPKLRTMTAVQVGTTVYKFHAKDDFVGNVPSYEFKVYPVGQR